MGNRVVWRSVVARREVVDFILDLVGYTTDQPLHQFRLVEPVPFIERCLTQLQPDGALGFICADPVDEEQVWGAIAGAGCGAAICDVRPNISGGLGFRAGGM